MQGNMRTTCFLSAAASLALLVLLLLLPGCKSLNPLCGSARPVPVLDSVSPTTIAFSQLPSSFSLNLTGSDFVSSSVIVFNGTTLSTTVVSSSQLTATVISSMISGPGSYSIQVQTPAGTSGDLGCSSGGNSSILTLTVTWLFGGASCKLSIKRKPGDLEQRWTILTMDSDRSTGDPCKLFATHPTAKGETTQDVLKISGTQ
jgi:hypothetical protein